MFWIGEAQSDSRVSKQQIDHQSTAPGAFESIPNRAAESVTETRSNRVLPQHLSEKLF